MNSIFTPANEPHGDEHLTDETEADVQARIDCFWSASGDDGLEADNWIAVECVDDPKAAEILRNMCSFKPHLRNADAILRNAIKLVNHLRSSVAESASKDKLPVTLLTIDDEDARAMARGEI